jgi:hypothetical protein
LSEILTNYSKRDIDKGSVPLQIYELCCCLREAFCLSYSIRKKNDLFLYFVNERIAIKFKGDKLRYLGPDERSQAILLKKSIHKREKNLPLTHWFESTPGIYIKQYDDLFLFFKEFYKLCSRNVILVKYEVSESVPKIDLTHKNALDNPNDEIGFILPLYNMLEKTPSFLQSLLENEDIDIKPIYILKIPKISDKILYLNHYYDSLSS